MEVLGGDCYVVINSKTGQIATYTKLIFDIPKLDMPKISKEEIADKIGKEVSLVIIPHINKLIYITKERMPKIFDTDAIREITGEEKEKLTKDTMKTDPNVGSVNKRTVTFGILSINNNQGVVFRDDDSMFADDINNAEASMERARPNNQPAWDSSASNAGVVTYTSTVNGLLTDYEGVYYSGHGDDYCIGLEDDNIYCDDDVDWDLQTRLFVISACHAGNDLADALEDNGVLCVVGASGNIDESYLGHECDNWADLFWDRATGNADYGSQLSASAARTGANAATWLNNCDLDTEKGTCSMYI